MMKKVIITVDLEEFVTPAEVGMDIPKKELFRFALDGFDNLIKVLTRHPRAKVTFFVTLEFARVAKDKIKNLIKQGHEIALHGLYHNTRLGEVTNQALIAELSRAKLGIEKLFNVKVRGFRSPQMRSISLSVLKKIGIKYDSSLHPTYIPGKYNHFLSQRGVFFNGIWEVPVSVTPVLRLPFSWVWFRNLGLGYAKICTYLTFLDQDCVNIYFHPWDFINLDIVPFKGNITRAILRNTGTKMIRNFDKYISWCESRFELVTMGGYLDGRS